MQDLHTTDGSKTSEIAKLILAQEDWSSVVEQEESSRDNEVDFSFKPITEGLGFNKPAPRVSSLAKKPPRKINQRFKSINRPVRNKEQLLRSMSEQAVRPVQEGRPTVTNGLIDKAVLNEFYQKGPAAVEQTIASNKKSKKRKKLLYARIEQRFMAWMIDSAIITLVVIGLFSAMASLANVRMSALINLENRYLISAVWALIYTIYFTLLDLDRSLGKSLLGIKVVQEHQQPISIMDTFMRTVVGLISLICFGIPLLLDLHGHLSDTKVVKWKH